MGKSEPLSDDNDYASDESLLNDAFGTDMLSFPGTTNPPASVDATSRIKQLGFPEDLVRVYQTADGGKSLDGEWFIHRAQSILSIYDTELRDCISWPPRHHGGRDHFVLFTCEADFVFIDTNERARPVYYWSYVGNDEPFRLNADVPRFMMDVLMKWRIGP